MEEKALRPWDEAADAASYRRPWAVEEVVFFRQGRRSFPLCPRCGTTFEREYVRFCDRCGQRLDWKRFDKALLRLR